MILIENKNTPVLTKNELQSFLYRQSSRDLEKRFESISNRFSLIQKLSIKINFDRF